MPISIVNSTTVTNSQLGPMVDGVIDIIGLGTNGYGLVNYATYPVTVRSRILANQVFGIYDDLQLIHQHVYGVSSSTTLSIQTGTNLRVVRPPTTNIIDTSTWIDLGRIYDYVTPRRYELAVSQRSTYTNVLGQIDDVFFTDTTSSRLTQWGGGVAGIYTSVNHTVTYSWPTEQTARYFFNTGGEITFHPRQTNLVGGAAPSKPIDRAFAQFIGSGTQFRSWFKYDRTAFLGASVGVYNTSVSSATILLTILTNRSADYKSVTFNASWQIRPGQASDASSGWIVYDDAVTAGTGSAAVSGTNANSASGTRGGSSTPWWIIGAVAILRVFGFSAICAKLYELGLFDQDLIKGDALFSQQLSSKTPEAIWGYHSWAWWVIEWMDGQGPSLWGVSRSRVRDLSRKWALTIAEPVAREMSWRAGHRSGRTSWTGRILLDLGLKVMTRMGRNNGPSKRIEPTRLGLWLFVCGCALMRFFVWVTYRPYSQDQGKSMLFNTTQEEFYQRWAELSEKERITLWKGMNLEALEIAKKLFPEEPLIDQALEFKRSE